MTSGPQVVPGYWEKPEETQNALPGGALRTGDVAYKYPRQAEVIDEIPKTATGRILRRELRDGGGSA